jgi:hypothetical protein
VSRVEWSGSVRTVKSDSRGASRGVLALAALIALALVLSTGNAAATPQATASNSWGADGQVHVVAVSGSTAYIGGDFNHVGPASSFAVGKFVALDAATGQAHGGLAPVFPDADQVLASAPDGSGGWYLGGTFQVVGDSGRDHLAHIEADG